MRLHILTWAVRQQSLFRARVEELLSGSHGSMTIHADDQMVPIITDLCSLGRQLAARGRAVEVAALLARAFDLYRFHSTALRQVCLCSLLGLSCEV